MTKESHPYFIPNGDSRQETAVLLVGTADEYGIDQRSIVAALGGFNISSDLATAVYGEADPDADATTDPINPPTDETVESPASTKRTNTKKASATTSSIG